MARGGGSHTPFPGRDLASCSVKWVYPALPHSLRRSLPHALPHSLPPLPAPPPASGPRHLPPSEKYWEYEYEEVITPNIYNFDLWKTSGHADHYRENMFSFDIEKQEFGLKPMNCPGEAAEQKEEGRNYERT